MQMKRRILLVDDSLTVQKVVALTLDRNRYSVTYAKNRADAIKWISESPPDLILVADQVSDLQVVTFPKEVEAWLGRNRTVPPIVLITGQDIKDARHYQAILKKPFSPQTLLDLVSRLANSSQTEMAEKEVEMDEIEEQQLQRVFNDTFADEAKLVKETFQTDAELACREAPDSPNTSEQMWAIPKNDVAPPPPTSPGTRVPTTGDLWSVAKPPTAAKRPNEAMPKPDQLLGAEDSMAYKAVLENKVESELSNKNLEEAIDRVLTRILPPMVERLVRERLDRLLKDQEQFMELKP